MLCVLESRNRILKYFRRYLNLHNFLICEQKKSLPCISQP